LKQLSSLLKISVSALFIFSSLSASGDDRYRFSSGAPEVGMGNVCITNRGFWSSFSNQASLGYNKTFSFGLNYSNKFGIGELSTRSAAIIVPAGKASIGVLYSGFGYADYKRGSTGLACGMQLSDKLSAGVQADYFSERSAGEYNNNQFITFETGLIYQPSETVKIGVHLFNPLPNSIRKTYLPATIRIGAGTDLNKLLFAGVEAEMSSGNQIIFKSGFEYEVAKKTWFRGGFSTNNSSFSFGMGYFPGFAQLDLGFATHEKLGVTSSVSLVFKIH
jgi:hypothetical protein